MVISRRVRHICRHLRVVETRPRSKHSVTQVDVFTKACIDDPVFHIADKILRLSINVSMGPVDCKFR